MYRLLPIIAALAIATLTACKALAQRGMRIVSYNVENLFDCSKDSVGDDSQFQPDASRHWSRSRYWRKQKILGQAIHSMYRDMVAPDIVGLLEVENDSVVQDLISRTSLRSERYRYVMTRSSDRRGMDVALLYQPATFRLLEWRSIGWHEMTGRGQTAATDRRKEWAGRDALYCKGVAFSGDTMHIVVCHLPSRIRGTEAKRQRNDIARWLRATADSIDSHCPGDYLVIMGDFNEDAQGRLFSDQLGAAPLPALVSGSRMERTCGRYTARMRQADSGHNAAHALRQGLYNLALTYTPRLPRTHHEKHIKVGGSYKYEGNWETIDNILVNKALAHSLGATDCHDGHHSRLRLNPRGLQVHSPQWMLEVDALYGGYKPKRTYVGYKYNDGISDHLPVYIDLDYIVRP